MLKSLVSLPLLFTSFLYAVEDNATLTIQYADPYTYNEPVVQNINDEDNDGIENKYDNCPATPNGVCVTAEGCTQKVKRVTHFNSSKYNISKEDYSKLESILEIAKECFGYKILLIGHTDSTYKAKYNQILSKHRAEAIKNFFIENKIKASRISLKWYGETKPIASNINKEGRYKNRRVDIIFY